MEKIVHKGRLVALRVRRFPNGTRGLTSPKDALQLLSQKRAKGHIVVPHRHIPKKRTTRLLQEGLVVIKGKLRVDLYDEQKNCFRRFLVRTSEAVVLLGVAHAIHFLEDSLVYEFKNGPFIDDKQFL